MNKNVLSRYNFDIIIVILCFLVISIVLAIGKDAIQLNRQGDAAIFEQLVNNLAAGKGYFSNVFANTQSYLETRQVTKPIAELLEQKASAPQPQERNMLGFHAYYILYPIALVGSQLTSSLLLTIFQFASFFGLVLGAVLIAKKELKLWYPSVIFALAIILNPNWFAGIMGQFYPDRLFILAGFLLCWLLYKNVQFWILFLAVSCIVLINERAALIAGMVVIAHKILFFKKSDTAGLLKGLCVGALALLYFYVQSKFILTNMYYSGFMPSNFHALIANLQSPGFVTKILVNLENNLLLIVFSLFSFRYALIAAMVMLPNLIGNVGGAEKVGWLTHYHSYYFPILVFSALAGFLNLYNFFVDSKSIRFAKTIFCVSILLAVVICYVAQNFYKINLIDVKPFSGIQQYKRSFLSLIAGEPTGLDLENSALKLFENTDVVSTTELGMALLHEKVQITVFPVGLDLANSVFIPCSFLDLTFEQKPVKQMLLDYGYSLVDISSNPIAVATTYCLLKK